MNKKYKIALGLGTVATVVAPIATVVACGDSGDKGVVIPNTPEVKNPGVQTPAVTSTPLTSHQAFDFASDLALFVDASSTLEDTVVAALSGAKTVAEMGYTEPILSAGTTATYTISRDVVTVVLHNGNNNSSPKTFNLHGVPSFDFTNDLALFVDAHSILGDTEVAALKGVKTAAEMGYTEPTLSAGTTATYSITNDVVTVMLHNGNDNSSPRTFKLHGVPSFDFTNDLALFVDAHSTLKDYEVDALNGNKTATELGYTMPTGLSVGTTAEFTASGQSIRVVLRNGSSKSLPKDFRLDGVFTYKFGSELSLFKDAQSTLKDVEVGALSGTKTATELGYTEPALNAGTTATYSISHGVVSVTLHNGVETSNTITFKLTGVPTIIKVGQYIGLLDASFTIPSTITTLEHNAFKYATLPNGLIWSATNAQGDPLPGATLVSAYVPKIEAAIKIVEDRKAPVEKVLSDALEAAKHGDATLAKQIEYLEPYTTGLLQNKVLPSWFSIASSVKSIEERAFWGVKLPAGFTIPYTVTSIGSQAFAGGVTLPAGFTIGSVTSIETDAFSEATLPAGFTIPYTVTNIDHSAFRRVTLPVGYMWSQLDNNGYPMATSSVVPVHIDPHATSIGKRAFWYLTLPAGFTIPNTVKSIGESAFDGVTLPTGYKWSKTDSWGNPMAGSSVVLK